MTQTTAFLTDEQRAVIFHPLNHHARVLAVAGAGKTTTMAHRVRHLVLEHGIEPRHICLLMFNRLARHQFRDRLAQVELAPLQQPRVHTFHSFAYRLIKQAVENSIIPPFREEWMNENNEEPRRLVLRLIQKMEYSGRVKPNSLDPEEALTAISMWKGALIPPERAGYRGKNAGKIVELYADFEDARNQVRAVGFDDFLPIVVDLLSANTLFSRRWLSAFQYIIVDEYQDVNYSQQRLIDLLAGKSADVMVVGDDDQTIYEWRGARPEYIMREFMQRYAHKPIDDYQLSRSFRFGPLIAQSAENTISYNWKRVSKPVIAHHYERPATIEVFSGEPADWERVNGNLADVVTDYIKSGKSLKNIVVLGRLFSQMNGLELIFLLRQIPYRVAGGSPLLERREITVLLDYVRLAIAFDAPMNPYLHALVLGTANTPNRMLRKADLSTTITQGISNHMTPRTIFGYLADDERSPYSEEERERFTDYVETVGQLSELLDEPAGAVLNWLVQYIGYFAHFDNYYGNSETAEDRKRAVMALCRYAERTGETLQNFVRHVASIDTTWGTQHHEQICLTSVHRVKGLEFDTVILPDVIEGYMPCLVGSEVSIFDKGGVVDEPRPDTNGEGERRLFYVALTRAKSAVYIGTVNAPQPDKKTGMIPDGVSIPSPYLAEMALALTKASVSALHSQDAGQMATHIAHMVTVRPLANNFLNVYLPVTGMTDQIDTLRHAIDQHAKPAPTPEELRAASEDKRLNLLREKLHLDEKAAKLPQSKSNNPVVLKAREKYPRAYEPWTADEEAQLLAMVDAGMKTSEIAGALQRQPGSISSRLNKLRP